MPFAVSRLGILLHSKLLRYFYANKTLKGMFLETSSPAKNHEELGRMENEVIKLFIASKTKIFIEKLRILYKNIFRANDLMVLIYNYGILVVF